MATKEEQLYQAAKKNDFETAKTLLTTGEKIDINWVNIDEVHFINICNYYLLK